MYRTLQDDTAKQAQYIDELQQAVAAKHEQLQLSQSQLEATQSSLIDLESHLTSLEEDNQPPRIGAELGQLAANEEDQQIQMQNLLEGLNTEEAEGIIDREESLASTIVDVFGDMFPASSEANSDSTAEEAALHEDPYELFEKGKAAVEGRGKRQVTQQPLSRQTPPSAQPQSDLPSSVSNNGPIDSLNKQSPDLGNGDLLWCKNNVN